MKYYQLDQSNLSAYLSALPEMQKIFSSFDDLDIREINDGNMNYAYMVTHKVDSRQSVFVKQAPPYIKVLGEQWPLTQQRMTAEISALKYQAQVCPQMVPKVFYQSEIQSILIMENLCNFSILRSALIQGQGLPNLAEDLSTFLARTLFYSSCFALSSEEKGAMVRQSHNLEMCRITEDFVFTYPFEHHEMNDYNPALPQPMIDAIQQDATVRSHVALMKYTFMNKPEALLHGDLHTGSIMVNEQQSYVIDPEFSFAGPMGFDLGALIANLYLNYFSHAHLSEKKSVDYSQWLLQTIEQLWIKFASKFLTLWAEHERNSDSAFMGKDLSGQSHQMFKQAFLKQAFADTLGFAACKMMRRILGVAKVADLMQFEDENLRAKLEIQALSMAKALLIKRHSFSSIAEVNKLAEDSR